MRLPWVWITCALVAVPALAQQTAPVPMAVEKFYRAYASGDRNAVKELWTKEESLPFVARVSRTLQTRCLVLHAVEVRQVTVEADRATARADAWLTRWSAMPGAVAEDEHQRATFALRLEGGAWKIESWRLAEDDLADRIANAAGAAERDALLREDSSLHTRRLVQALSRRGVAARNESRPDRAAALAAAAMEVAVELEDRAARSDALGVEGVLQRAQPRNDVEGSVSTAYAALELAEEVKDPDVLGRALLRLGTGLLAADDPRSVAAFERAMALADFVEDRSILALASSGAARAHDSAGRLREALRAGILAARWAEASGEPAAIISAELNLAGSYLNRQDADLALPHAERAARLAEKAGFVSIQAAAESFIAYAYNVSGDGPRFLATLSRAIALLDSADGDARTLVEMLRSRAWVSAGRGDFATAESDLRKAFSVVAQMPKPLDQVELENTLAYLRERQGRPAEALPIIERALRLGGLYPHAHSLLMTQGAVLEALGRFEEARRVNEDALDSIETVRASIDYERERTLWFHDAAGAFANQVALLVRMGERREALMVAERMKARELQDLRTSSAAGDLAGDATIEARSARVVALNRELLVIERDGGDTAAVHARLRRARGELDEAKASADQPIPPLPQARTLDASVIDVPPGTTVIEYVVGEKRTTAFLLRKQGGDTRVRTHTVEVSALELRTLVEDYVRRIEQRDAHHREVSRRLYDLLVAPLLGAQPGPDTLCIIPDSVLGTLPFQALIAADGRYVIEHTAIFYSPSLSMLNAPRSPKAARAPTLLALGDPDLDTETRSEIRGLTGGGILGRLPDAEREVREIGRMYGSRSTVRVGREAAEALVKKRAGDYDVLHLATHGIIDERTPLYSAVVLTASETEDGLLEAREIVDLPLHAELVVLSACDTAGGRVLSGEGVMGVSWAMLAAGTPRVVATQWPVGSAASARLMVAFHQGLAKRPAIANVAETLRVAQLRMLHRRNTAHPYYWAGFVLIGRDQ
jgi:CHAT domain-containing protein/tetratricopeptide (TPR) repeat protein